MSSRGRSRLDWLVGVSTGRSDPALLLSVITVTAWPSAIGASSSTASSTGLLSASHAASSARSSAASSARGAATCPTVGGASAAACSPSTILASGPAASMHRTSSLMPTLHGTNTFSPWLGSRSTNRRPGWRQKSCPFETMMSRSEPAARAHSCTYSTMDRPSPLRSSLRSTARSRSSVKLLWLALARRGRSTCRKHAATTTRQRATVPMAQQ